MKNAAIIAICIVALTGCYAGPMGEVVGVQDREDWMQINPYGMNYIHFGSYTMGPSDQDVPYALNARSKTVTIPPFYMDVTEISNNEYRQFVHWVRDSLQRDMLAQNDDERFFYTEDGQGRDLDRFIKKGYILRWDEEIDWEDEDVFDLLYDEFYLQGSDRFYDRAQLNTRKLTYKYWWMNLQDASRKSGLDEEYGEQNSLGQLYSVRGHSDRSQFLIEENVPVYPDTLCWIRDFSYGFNEPLAETYFWHPAYDNYPVVGVTWGQAKAFNAWRTQLLSTYHMNNGETIVQKFRLPSEAEWEYAARGGLELAPYPWGGPYMRNIMGCPLANFKPMRGDYVEDNGCYTVPIESYSANDYGLFQMAGNVAEWTNTAFDETVYDFSHDMSSEYAYSAKVDDPPSLKRKVIRGGSWKDIGYYCQVGTRSFEYQDTAKSYVGFRSVMSYLGRGKSVLPEDFN